MIQNLATDAIPLEIHTAWNILFTLLKYAGHFRIFTPSLNCTGFKIIDYLYKCFSNINEVAERIWVSWMPNFKILVVHLFKEMQNTYLGEESGISF